MKNPIRTGEVRLVYADLAIKIARSATAAIILTESLTKKRGDQRNDR